MNSVTILIVEDDAGLGIFLDAVLSEAAGRQVVLVTSSLDALNVVKNVEPNLFILDYHLPYMNGLELYKQLHALENFKDVPTIIMSAGLPFLLEAELEKFDIYFISKPFDLDHLLDVVENTLTQDKI